MGTQTDFMLIVKEPGFQPTRSQVERVLRCLYTHGMSALDYPSAELTEDLSKSIERSSRGKYFQQLKVIQPVRFTCGKCNASTTLQLSLGHLLEADRFAKAGRYKPSLGTSQAVKCPKGCGPMDLATATETSLPDAARLNEEVVAMLQSRGVKSVDACHAWLAIEYFNWERIKVPFEIVIPVPEAKRKDIQDAFFDHIGMPPDGVLPDVEFEEHSHIDLYYFGKNGGTMAILPTPLEDEFDDPLTSFIIFREQGVPGDEASIVEQFVDYFPTKFKPLLDELVGILGNRVAAYNYDVEEEKEEEEEKEGENGENGSNGEEGRNAEACFEVSAEAEREKAARERADREEVSPKRKAKEEEVSRSKVEEEARKPRENHDTALTAGEHAAMMGLKQALGGVAIPAVPDVKWSTFGFTADKGHVVKLGLYRKGLTSLPEIITRMTWLQEIYLGGNQLSSLPESMGNLASLTLLDLRWNQLSSLPESLGKLGSLQQLWLGSNELSSLPEAITRMIGLQALDLSKNQLSALPESLRQLKSLQTLRLDDNQLSSLPVAIGNLVNLETLDLMKNQLSSLPASIGNLISLIRLDIKRNQLSSLPESIGQLQSLQELMLGANKLSALPESMGRLNSLQTLEMHGNTLSALPEIITGMTWLKSLDVGGGQLLSLPDSIGQLRSLQKLWLSANWLSSLPESIGNLTSLTQLDLNNNLLSSLPESIRNLNSLQEFWLIGNKLSSLPGTIKVWLEELKKKGCKVHL